MITEIPTAEEFARQGMNHLHLAWEIGVALLRELKDAEYYDDVDPKSYQEYWKLSQPSLSNALALIQQSQEFLLKSRIAKVSPFLLLSRDARDWPRRCEKQDTPFSSFRMSDAVDLIKIHDTVRCGRLPKGFATFHDDVRRQRNIIMHFGAGSKPVDVTNVLFAVLQTHGFLLSDKSWAEHRWEFINSDRISALYSNDHAGDAILTEFDAIVEILKPSPLRKFFNFDKKARRYICPVCMDRTEHLDYRPAFAQLHPNAPETKVVYCFVCGSTIPVRREACPEAGCPSNVLSDEDGTCLVCWC
jgi:hypothetical protein